MKNIWFMLLTVCTMFAFSACSDDDEKNPTNPVIKRKSSCKRFKSEKR